MKEEDGPLSAEEEKLFMSLLPRAVPTPGRLVKLEVFLCLMRNTISIPIELGIFSPEGILVLPRKASDPEYSGCPLHVPGTVLRIGETYEQALARLIQGEVRTLNLDASKIFEICTHRTLKGNGADQNPSRDEVHVCFATGVAAGVVLPDGGKWVDPAALPNNLISYQYSLINHMAEARNRMLPV